MYHFLELLFQRFIHFQALTRLGSYLNMKTLVVTSEYRDAFIRALITFKHQLVYCPLRRKQVRLHPPGPEITEEQLHFAGDEIDEDLAYQMALGNCDPFTSRQLHNFDPDRSQVCFSRINFVISRANMQFCEGLLEKSSHCSRWNIESLNKRLLVRRNSGENRIPGTRNRPVNLSVFGQTSTKSLRKKKT